MSAWRGQGGTRHHVSLQEEKVGMKPMDRTKLSRQQSP